MEAYNTNKQQELAEKTIVKGRKLYPNAIPLKVYYYLNTKDPDVKADLTKNHSQQWLIQSFQIK